MVEGGMMKLVKWCVFGFNLLFFIFGIALFALGIAVQVKFKDYLDFFQSDVNGPAIVIIIIGTITVIVAFFGCCGAVKENACMLITFSVLIGVIFICELGAGIAAYVLKNKLSSFAKEEMLVSMTNYGSPNHGGVTLTWDNTQKMVPCCGVTDYHDWKTKFPEKYNETYSAPDSCCKDPPCHDEYTDKSNKTVTANVYETGCLSGIQTKFVDNAWSVGGVAVAFAVIEILGIIFAVLLARSMRSEYNQA